MSAPSALLNLTTPRTALMSAFQIPYDHCAAPGCASRPMTWSRYCPKCTQRLQRYGHTAALSLRRVDLARHSERIAHALANLERAPAVIAAHTEAERLLNYRAPHGAPKGARELDSQMRRLRFAGTVPREVVQRACEVFFLDQDGTFYDLRSCQFALARQVLLIRKLGTYRAGSRLLAFMGELLHDRFAVFAVKLRKHTDDETEEARMRRDAMLHGWTAAPDTPHGDRP